MFRYRPLNLKTIQALTMAAVASLLLVYSLAAQSDDADLAEDLSVNSGLSSQYMAQLDPDQERYYIEKELRRGYRRLQFDVVELATKFVFDEAPVDDNGMPGYGNPFITQGVIYPSGVLQVDENGVTNGVIVETDANGNTIARPEFPDLVLGTWICRGTVFTENGFQSGPIVYSTQLFDFETLTGEFGRISFETAGLELIEVGKPIRRALNGGTGPYRNSRGDMQQTLVGANASTGFSLRFVTRFR